MMVCYRTKALTTGRVIVGFHPTRIHSRTFRVLVRVATYSVDGEFRGAKPMIRRTGNAPTALKPDIGRRGFDYGEVDWESMQACDDKGRSPRWRPSLAACLTRQSKRLAHEATTETAISARPRLCYVQGVPQRT